MASIHHVAITSSRSLLVSELQKGDIDSLVDNFYEKGMISPEERDTIQSTQEKDKKARDLVNALENKVKNYPSQNYYEIFTTLLASKSSEYQKLNVALESKITELEEPRSRPSSGKTYVSQSSCRSELEDSFVISECLCGNCNIFDGPPSCPKSPPLRLISQEEQISIGTSEVKYSDYRHSLMEQTHDINSKFKALLVHTTQELKSKVALPRVKNTVGILITPQSSRSSQYSCIYKHGVKGRLRDVKTHEELETYLENNFCCWFNVDLIKNLRKTLLYSEIEDHHVCEYKKQLGQYLKKSCFEIPSRDPDSAEKRTEIICMVSTDFSKLKEQQIKIFEYILRGHIAMPDCIRRVDQVTGELKFTMRQPTRSIIQSTGSPSESIDVSSVHPIFSESSEMDSCNVQCTTKKVLLWMLTILVPCLLPLTIYSI